MLIFPLPAFGAKLEIFIISNLQYLLTNKHTKDKYALNVEIIVAHGNSQVKSHIFF